MQEYLIKAFNRVGGIAPLSGGALRPMTEDEIAVVESRIGARLPEGYRAFLAAFGEVLFVNSVRFSPASETAVYPYNDEADEPTPTFSGSQVCVLYGSSSLNGGSLLEKISVYANRMPASVIPIGDDGMGSKIALCVSGERAGSVYWWDHEHEWDEEEYEDELGVAMPEAAKWQNLYLIAESFEEFVSKLEIVGK